MRRPLLVPALLIAASVASGERRWKDLKEARQAVEKARVDALELLEKERLPIPEAFLEADARRRDARRAWQAERWDDANAAYEAAFDLYAESVARGREELAALPAAEKAAPRMRSQSARAVEAALGWLSRHQDPIGRWDCARFMKHDPKDDACDGAGDRLHDVGVTALAALAFLESGASVRQPEVHRALQWLRAQPDENGFLGSRESHARIYDHAIATLALARAHGASKDARYLAQLGPALDCILAAQTAGAGWRYEGGDGESDTSVTCWCYRALAAGAEAGIGIDLGGARSGARAWVVSMTGDSGIIGYNLRGGHVARPEGKNRWTADRSRAMTAAGVVLLLLADPAADRKRVLQSLDRCLERPPVWNPDDGSIDMYYWYYGTLACAADKTRATKWKKPLLKAVLQHQHQRGAGAREGSFDPIGVWGSDGGRVYSTAILALTLLHAE
jgi:hypothetical protein